MQNSEPLLSVKIGPKGVMAVHVMAYSEAIEEKADQLYKKVKKHLHEIDKSLSTEAETDLNP